MEQKIRCTKVQKEKTEKEIIQKKFDLFRFKKLVLLLLYTIYDTALLKKKLVR